MKRFILLAILFSFPCTAFAEEDHLGFVRGLRGRGYSDLALIYLEKLQKRQDLPKEVVLGIPLEVAATSLDLAAAEQNERRRARHLQAAERGFKDCTRSGDQAVAVEAAFGLARIESLRAQDVLRSALRAGPSIRARETNQAMRDLKKSAESLRNASAGIKKVLPSQSGPRKDALAHMHLQAEYELALNLFDQMRAIIDGDFKMLAAANTAALEQFRAVAGMNDKDPLYWQARAWIGRCHQEADMYTEAAAEFTRIATATESQAYAGKRLAAYFRLLGIEREAKTKDPLSELIHHAERWLNDYGDHVLSPETRDVHSRLGRAYMALAKKQPGRADAHNLKAEEHFAVIDPGDDDLAGDARQRRMQLLAKRLKLTPETDAASLNDVTACMVRAQVEVWEMAKDPTKAAANQKQHYQRIVAALDRALQLADERTPANERAEAMATLAYAHLILGSVDKVIELADALTRSDPDNRNSSTAAAYALHAYTLLLARMEKEGGDADKLNETREKHVRLAMFTEQTWPDSPAADFARHQLGLLALRAKKYDEANGYLANISSRYGSSTLAQYQRAHVALMAQREKVDPPNGVHSWLKLAEETLTRIPDPSPRADSETISYYFLAKLELAKIRFQLRQFSDMDTLVKHLRAIFDQLENEDHKKDVQPSLDALALYAAYGRADTAFSSGRPDRWRTIVPILDPIIDQMQKRPVKDVDPQLLRALLGMALRASIQEGRTKQAVGILEMAEKSGNEFEGTSAVLIDLVAQMRADLEELRNKGPAHQKELTRTSERFGEFLDQIGKNLGDKPAKERLRFLALAYSALGRHDQAADLLGKIPKPKEPLSPEDERFYQSMRLLYARELRLDKKHDQARKELDAILAEDWGKKNLEAKKEQISLLEDEEKFGQAKVRWFNLAKDLKEPSRSNPQLKEQYYECYYRLTWCAARQGSTAKDDTAKKKYLREAASFITSLEKADETMGGNKERYQKLLADMPDLKREYDNLKESQK